MVAGEVSAERLRRDVERLPAPRSRLHSPARMAAADEMIAEGLSAAGWKVESRPYELTNVAGYLDYAEGPFPAGSKLKFYPHLAGVNILGIKEGAASTDAIVVGAHHDTVRDSPGADDNTASVAALLELARVLAPYRFDQTILLAAFDMEEIHYFGSRALVAQLSLERRIAGAIVYESVAYMDPAPRSQTWPRRLGLLYPGQWSEIRRRRFAGDWNLVVYRRSARALARAFTAGLAMTAGPAASISMCDWTDLPAFGRLLKLCVPAVANFARSDHLAFWKSGIPAIMVTDTGDLRNPHYHQPTDTPETLDYARLAAIVGATAIGLGRLARLAPPPVQPGSSDSSSSPA
jgi:Peptidase family M28